MKLLMKEEAMSLRERARRGTWEDLGTGEGRQK